MDALLRSQDTNHIRFATLLARVAPDGLAESWDGVSVAVTGAPLAGFNTAFITTPPTSGETYDQLLSRLRDTDVPFTVQVPDDIVEHVAPELRARGLREPTDVPGMRLRVARHREPDLPPGLSVAPVGSRDDHVRWVQTGAAAFGMDPAVVAQVHPPQLLREPGYVELLGVVSGEAAAIAAAVLVDDVVGVYAVAVPEPYRRQGLGRALTAAAVAWGTRQGATAAVLQSTAAGLRLYQGLGFRTVRTYHRFAGGA